MKECLKTKKKNKVMEIMKEIIKDSEFRTPKIQIIWVLEKEKGIE